MKKNNKKGFTLAELLIVVAIIAVLVAIAIPVFSAQLEKSREATDVANVRSAYATLTTSWLTDPSSASMTVKAQQKESGWKTNPEPKLETMKSGSMGSIDIPAKTSTYTVKINASGTISIN